MGEPLAELWNPLKSAKDKLLMQLRDVHLQHGMRFDMEGAKSIQQEVGNAPSLRNKRVNSKQLAIKIVEQLKIFKVLSMYVEQLEDQIT